VAFGGQNPGIWGESVRKALNPGEERTAQEHGIAAKQTALDSAELRELELSGSYGATSEVRRQSGLRGILDRLFRRSP